MFDDDNDDDYPWGLVVRNIKMHLIPGYIFRVKIYVELVIDGHLSRVSLQIYKAALLSIWILANQTKGSLADQKLISLDIFYK